VTRVLIVSDIRLYREGIALLLRREREMQPVAEAADIAQAVVCFRETKPDVVLLDGAMPDSVGAVRVLGVEECDAVVLPFPSNCSPPPSPSGAP
jgi:DNA-binding NarL/FixJ family response regulator